MCFYCSLVNRLFFALNHFSQISFLHLFWLFYGCSIIICQYPHSCCFHLNRIGKLALSNSLRKARRIDAALIPFQVLFCPNRLHQLNHSFECSQRLRLLYEQKIFLDSLDQTSFRFCSMVRKFQEQLESCPMAFS